MVSREAASLTLSQTGPGPDTEVPPPVWDLLCLQGPISPLTTLTDSPEGEPYSWLFELTEIQSSETSQPDKMSLSPSLLFYQPVQEEALDLSLKRKKHEDDEEQTVTPFIPFKRGKSSPGEPEMASRPGKTREQNNNRFLSFEGRKTKSKTQKKIAQIREMCDCRFCYEDHILRMRLKLSKMLWFS